jgi:crotonobetainyl-CoA:carnitine CoA-transferase CaiB-like acyl-CoA transferase
VGLPILFGDDPREAGAPPPMHGEHTEVILRELGFSPERINALRAEKVIN